MTEARLPGHARQLSVPPAPPSPVRPSAPVRSERPERTADRPGPPHRAARHVAPGLTAKRGPRLRAASRSCGVSTLPMVSATRVMTGSALDLGSTRTSQVAAAYGRPGGAQACGNEGGQGDPAGDALASVTYKCGLSRSQHTTVPRYPLFRPRSRTRTATRRTTLTLRSVSIIVRAAIPANPPQARLCCRLGRTKGPKPSKGTPIRVGLTRSR
jgi:hypothetical protein